MRKCFSRKHSCKNMAPTPQRMREARAAAPQVPQGSIRAKIWQALPRKCAKRLPHRRCLKEAFVRKYGTHSPENARSAHRTFGVSATFGGSAPQGSTYTKISQVLPNRIREAHAAPHLRCFCRLRRKCFSRKHSCKDMAPTPQRIRAKRELPRCKRPQVPAGARRGLR